MSLPVFQERRQPIANITTSSKEGYTIQKVLFQDVIIHTCNTAIQLLKKDVRY